MKLRLSKSMLKCIEEIKEESFDIIENLENFKLVKVRRKPTKKKIMDFHIMNIKDSPFIQVFINERFVETLFLENGKWKEETKNFDGS